MQQTICGDQLCCTSYRLPLKETLDSELSQGRVSVGWSEVEPLIQDHLHSSASKILALSRLQWWDSHLRWYAMNQVITDLDELAKETR